MSLAGTLDASRTQTDDQLIAAVREGDDRAYEQLYERYQRRICAYIVGMVHDHGRAEDLTQDVFVAALRRMRKTDAPITFKPWIYEIAKNACIDAYRRSRRGEEVSIESESGVFDTAELTSPAALPETAVAAKQQIDDLCGAFGGLSDAHHQILVMRELEGLTYAEIGDRLGMTRPSVESTLFRARRRLTEEYDQLVSGERCIAVQSMLTTGRIGRRDERRVARHVAHCVQCRRHAHLAGHDFVATRRSAAIGRVAAVLPIPAFLRFRKGGGGLTDSASLAGWSQSVATVAEPALGWGKALAATAAVLAAGGAGAVAHHHTGRPAAVEHRKPLHQIVGEHSRVAPRAALRAGASAGTKSAAGTPRTRSAGTARHGPPGCRTSPGPRRRSPSTRRPSSATRRGARRRTRRRCPPRP